MVFQTDSSSLGKKVENEIELKCLEFSYINTVETGNALELEYPSILLNVTIDEIKLVYAKVFELENFNLISDYDKLLLFLDSNTNQKQNSSKKLIYPIYFLRKFDFINRDIDLLKMVKKLMIWYNKF